MNADIIMPVCAANEATLNMSQVAIRTCKASTSARLLVIGNNTPNQDWRTRLRWNCELLGARWVYDDCFDGNFSLSRVWNKGATMTDGEYIAYTNADAIFYPNWLENLIGLWRQEPEYWIVVPFSFDCRNYPCERTQVAPEPRIVPSHNPAGAVQVFRRDSGWKWDEQFPLWEMDADITLTLERYRRRGGVAYNSRVDHLCSGFVHNVKYEDHFGPNAGFSTATTAFRKKWGLKDP